MPDIQVLDEKTIEMIAAGEVIENPASIVKELVENSIDAGAKHIRVEAGGGGIDFLRITDDGCGIAKDQVRMAFLRHATSKIRNASDLSAVRTMGFRGEALASVSAVARVEMITKTAEDELGTRIVIEGSKEKTLESVGAPNGTDIIIRDVFFNTPARRKFLKSASTEGSHVGTAIEHLSLCNPGISFDLTINGRPKLHTSGNGNGRDVIYKIYGREISNNLIEVNRSTERLHVEGFLGKPVITRGNRALENYFINSRYIKSNIINKAIEDGMRPFMMLHQYPFCSLSITVNEVEVDVNVHPQKMELRFSESNCIYNEMLKVVREAINGEDLVPREEDTASKASERKVEGARLGIPKTEADIPDAAASRPADSSSAGSRSVDLISVDPIQADSRQVDLISVDPRQADSSSITLRPDVSKQETQHTENVLHQNTAQQVPFQSAQQTKIFQPIRSVSPENSGRNTAPPHSKITPADVPMPDSDEEKKHIFLQKRLDEIRESIKNDTPYKRIYPDRQTDRITGYPKEKEYDNTGKDDLGKASVENLQQTVRTETKQCDEINRQITLLDVASEDPEKHADFIRQVKEDNFILIGQLFDTYWLAESDNQLFVIDQHAAHEKILFERNLKRFKENDFYSQQISPPVILTLDSAEQQVLDDNMELFEKMGFEIGAFGGNDVAISAVPDMIYSVDRIEFFKEILILLSEDREVSTEIMWHRIATASCKAAVKGNTKLSFAEAKKLISELLTLDNPYHCPHGRPVIFTMTKSDIEKRFKRIV